jgi:cell division protein FtsZ
MYETEPSENISRRATDRGDEYEDGFYENLKLGHDVRFLLVAVGGGAIRIGSRIAQQRLRYLETVAVNCDTRVQGAEDFDREICLGPETGADGDTGGSTLVGGILARAAEPALTRLFDGAHFVTIIASLGGGAGTGALPVVLRAAARSSEVLSVFVVKPFACEPDRRAMAERAIARLHFVDSFVEKQHRGLATLEVLDNEAMARQRPSMPFGGLDRHWAGVVTNHIERTFVLPAEAALEASRRASAGSHIPINVERPSPLRPVEPPTPHTPYPIPSVAPMTAFAPALMALGDDAELTFEVEMPARLPELR